MGSGCNVSTLQGTKLGGRPIRSLWQESRGKGLVTSNPLWSWRCPDGGYSFKIQAAGFMKGLDVRFEGKRVSQMIQVHLLPCMSG